MIKTLFGFVLCVVIGNGAYAQKNGMISTYMRTDRSVVNKIDVGASKEDAEFIRIVSPPDTSIDKNLYQVSDFYLTGKPKLSGLSRNANFAYVSFEGPCVEYYPNGKKKSIRNFHEGKQEGYANSYYPNGKMYLSEKYEDNKTKLIAWMDSTGKVLTENGNGSWVKYSDDFKDIEREGIVKDSLEQGEWKGKPNDSVNYVCNYEAGVIKSGTSYDKQGNKYPFTKIETIPEFKGGNQKLGLFLLKSIRYPAAARERRVQGRVIVTFIVDEGGFVTDAKVIRGEDMSLNDEALRVVRSSPKWIPGTQYGVPVRTAYTIPISFSIDDRPGKESGVEVRASGY